MWANIGHTHGQTGPNTGCFTFASHVQPMGICPLALQQLREIAGQAKMERGLHGDHFRVSLLLIAPKGKRLAGIPRLSRPQLSVQKTTDCSGSGWLCPHRSQERLNVNGGKRSKASLCPFLLLRSTFILQSESFSTRVQSLFNSVVVGVLRYYYQLYQPWYLFDAVYNQVLCSVLRE